jgi:manganese transport protein
VSRISGLTLGIVTALGGFVDIGELVFASQAGARFAYALLWPVVLGVLAIIVYSEMCGRVAIVTGKPVFTLVRERLGYTLGFCALVASTFVNVLTCAAEVGGVAIVIRLLIHLPYGVAVAIVILLLVAIVSILPFTMLERVFGLCGLLMLVFVAAALSLGVDWGQAARGLLPSLPSGGGNLVSYAYMAVGLIAATVMPYEVLFYSSGNIEEEKTPDDLIENTITAVFGLAFGSLVTLALIVLGAQVMLPQGVMPTQVGSSMLGPIIAFGLPGLLIAIAGVLAAIGGAAVETSLSGAYAIAQFFGFEWGKEDKAWHVPRFTLSWLGVFGLAAVVLVSGLDPVVVTEYAVIFSVLVLPLTYLPILLVARDRRVMGEHANNRLQDMTGVVFLGLICVIAVLAVPLMYLSRMGQA